MISRSRSILSALDCSSKRMAFCTNGISTITPRSLISSLRMNSSHTASGTGKRDSLRWISISVSTSRLLYALNRAHRSGSSDGVCCPVQKNRIRSLPSVSFCLSIFSTAPTSLSDCGRDRYVDQTIEHRHETGERYVPVGIPRKRDRQTRSNETLCAHLMTRSSVSAATISSGIVSPFARSITVTSASSAAYPNSVTAKSGASTYL